MLHFAFIYVYAQPFSANNSKLRYYSQWYVYPFFHQGWNVFVPAPTANYKLLVEFESKGSIKTLDVFREIKNRHQANRLRGYEPILLAFSGCLYVVEKNNSDSNLKGDTLNFKLLEHATTKYLNHFYDKDLKRLKLFLIANEIHTSQEKVFYN